MFLSSTGAYRRHRHAAPVRRARTMLRLCLGAIASATLGLAHAQQAASLPGVVITASRMSQAVVDALPSTRLITREDIDRSGAADLGSLMLGLTSIDVGRLGPLGSQTSLFLRGADSRQVLLLVDGTPMSRADFGTASWQNLPLDQVERVEIVRGNLSSVWGSQAVGGVVHVITRRASAPQVSFAAGSHGNVRASFAGGASFGPDDRATRLSASASQQRTDGFSARDPAGDESVNLDRDGGRQRGGNLRLDQTWAPGQRTSVHLLGSATRSQYDSSGAGIDDVLDTWTSAAGLQSRHALGEAFELGVDLGQTRERFRDPTGFVTEGSNRVRQGSLQLQWQPSAAHTLQLGTETKREFFEGAAPPGRNRRIESVRAGWVGRYFEDTLPLEAQFNLRHDRSSAFGTADTGLIGLAFELRPGLKLSSIASTAFSPPSFLDEQFANPATQLRAERSVQRELALQWVDADTRLRAGLFDQRQRDRLSFDPVTFETINIARGRNRGLELIGETTVGADRVTMEATFQDPRDLDTGKRLKRRARVSALLQLQHDFGAWQATAAVRHTGKRLDTDPVTFTDAMNRARTTLDLGATWQFAPTWRLGGRLANATGTQRPEVLGYTAPPRSVMLQVEGRL